MALKALDISKHQGTFAPGAAKAAGVETVILRAAYGGFADARYWRFAADCRAQGLRMGAYIFLTHHYQGKNNGDPAQARKILRSHMATLLDILQGREITSWVALDQELEGGQQMGLAPADNTLLLNEAADMLRAAGYTPCLYCSASWLQGRVQVDKLGMPVWLAYYYKDPNDPDFDGCASIGEVQTKWGRYMASLGDKLCGWQFGRIGCGGRYGVGSTNVDRDWIYFQPGEGEEKPMGWTKIEGRQLRCTSAEKPACEVFEAPAADAKVVGRLELGEACEVLAEGTAVALAGMTGIWYLIARDGDEGYCLALPDRCVVEDKPAPEPEPEPTPEPEPLADLQAAVSELRAALAGLADGRGKSLAVTKLDECEMWAARAR